MSAWREKFFQRLQARGVERKMPPIPTRILEGIDFIVGHVSGPQFPRNISTAATTGRQVTAYSREEVLRFYMDANWLDCRINAYPVYLEYKGINRQAPNFLFIDLDRSSFSSDRQFEDGLHTTLEKMSHDLGTCQPTVIWSGNGYHIYQPTEAPILEQIDEFAQFEQPSVKLVRYAEYRFTNGRSDPSHKPSFKSCLIRVPGSLNLKCKLQGRHDDAEVRIVQKWNGYRPSIVPILKDFYTYLVNEKIQELERQAQLTKHINRKEGNGSSREVRWIETLLQIPIDDYRRNTVGLILAPYLINIRQLSFDQAFNIISSWLDNCSKKRPLGFRPRYVVNEALRTALVHKYKPLSLRSLRERNSRLYTAILQTMPGSEY